MFMHPQLNPVAFSLGPIKVYWYGLMYLFGFISARLLALWRVKHYHLAWTKEQIDDLIFYAAIGVIVGGRCGYMLLYNTHETLLHPLNILKIWEGGMSFHGGLLGVMLALLILAKHLKKSFWEVTDFMIPLVPLGLAAGRVGNFINGELWGRVSSVPWAMIFPHVDYFPRHPSQLYECALEGIGLFILIWWYANKPRASGCVSAVFLIGYAVCRLTNENFREPDTQLGYLAFQSLTMGQLLSIPMLLAGIFLYFLRNHKHARLS